MGFWEWLFASNAHRVSSRAGDKLGEMAGSGATHHDLGDNEVLCGRPCATCGAGTCTKNWHSGLLTHRSSASRGGCGHDW